MSSIDMTATYPVNLMSLINNVHHMDGSEIDGGDYWEGRREPGDYRWARFTVTFEDGGRLMLLDPRRVGRIRLNPPVGQLALMPS